MYNPLNLYFLSLFTDIIQSIAIQFIVSKTIIFRFDLTINEETTEIDPSGFQRSFVYEILILKILKFLKMYHIKHIQLINKYLH